LHELPEHVELGLELELCEEDEEDDEEDDDKKEEGGPDPEPGSTT
jgi:hypothetical protein